MLTKKELGFRIRKLREKSGLSQHALGKVLGKSHAAISDLENGKTDLSVTELLVLAKCLNTPVDFILNIQTSGPEIVFQLNGNTVNEVESKNAKIKVSTNSQTFFL